MYVHAVSEFAAACILRVLDHRGQRRRRLGVVAETEDAAFLRCGLPVLLFARLVDVLSHTTSERYGQCLYASADAQNGNLTVVSQPCDEQFGQVALLVDAVQLRGWLVSGPERVQVGTAAEQQSVQLVKRVGENMAVGHRWNDDGHAPGLYHRIIITFAQCRFAVVEIACNAYQRLLVGFWKVSINVV